MFTAKQQVLLQVAAAVCIIFFLALIGGVGAGGSLIWGLIVGLVLFLILRQNAIVAGETDIMQGVYSERLRPAGAVIGETFGIGNSSSTAHMPATIVGSGGTTSEEAVSGLETSQPEMLASPRDGQADDLKRINGIGPKLEAALNDHGIYHFDQIAKWGPKEVAWADEKLSGFRGHASRNDWVGQAKAMMTPN